MICFPSRTSSPFVRLYLFVLLVVVLLCVRSVFSQQIRILNEAIVSPPQGGQHSWYDIEADPENAKNLIVCGMRWDAKDNAERGFVYSSQDGGMTWRLALEDKHSSWVSEESCAYGVHGVAYFIADTSKIDDAGGLHHDQGITRIYVSRDGGKNWTLGTETGWTDFSASVVDINKGENENRLYVFFNNLWTYYSSVHDQGKPTNLPKFTDKVSDFDTTGNTIGLISYKYDDVHPAGPFYNDVMYKLRLHGSYPAQNLLLKDGSLLTLFWSKRKTFGADGRQDGREFILAAQHTDSQRRVLSEPVVLQQATEIHERQPLACNSYLSAPAAYDKVANKIYTVYLGGQGTHCTLMLATSTDNGATWASHPWVEKSVPLSDSTALPERRYKSLALARNNDGAMALLWRDTNDSDCWNFAASTDDGLTYSHPKHLSGCQLESKSKYRLSSATLDFFVAQADPSDPRDYASLRIENHDNFARSHTAGIAVSRDGVFHPVWVTFGKGEGQLHTAAIVIQALLSSKVQDVELPEDWREITGRVQFLYGGDQHYDPASGLLTVKTIIRNSGKQILQAPLRLEITANSDVGTVYPVDVQTEGVKQYWDVGGYLPSGGLLPGDVSRPIPVILHFVPDADAEPSDSLASLSMHLLAMSASANPLDSRAKGKEQAPLSSPTPIAPNSSGRSQGASSNLDADPQKPHNDIP